MQLDVDNLGKLVNLADGDVELVNEALRKNLDARGMASIEGVINHILGAKARRSLTVIPDDAVLSG